MKKINEEEPSVMTSNMNQNGILSSIKPLCDFKTPMADTDDPDCLFRNHWLNKGNCGLLISGSGIGKSVFVIQTAVHWGKGESMLGICPTRPLKTLIVQSEDDDYDIVWFRNGTRTGLAMEYNLDNRSIMEAEKNVLVGTSCGLTDDDFFEWLSSNIQACRPDLVIINPLHAFFGGNLNESQSCSKFLRQGLDPIIKANETKCGVIIVHHTGKPKESSGNILSYIGNGSAELTNYPRSILSIIPHKNLKGVFELVGAKHGDRLNWRNSLGHIVTSKVICYANKLPRYADKGNVIYWIEPTSEELAYVSAHQNSTIGDGSPAREVSQVSLKKANDKGLEENALALVKHVKSNTSGTITNKSLREHAATKWMTQAARSAVKVFENIRNNHGIGKDGKYYTHNAQEGNN